MSDHCIIRADFSNWRPVQGRKVMQLIFELPIEEAEAALMALGIPQPGENKWCAIALLENGRRVSGSVDGPQKSAPKLSAPSDPGAGQTGKEPSPTTAITAAATTSEIQNHDRKPFASLPLSQQIGIRCNDPKFQEFVKTEDAQGAAQAVRRACHVESRAFILDGSPAGAIWVQLERQYQAWLTDRQFAEARR